ncbi:acyl-CoA carboxylase subunit epsilon [Streptomyces sp. NPDC060322]|uniref:acyl-CoA carboxylase subunit epsilon n=1 Tax=unclassified Streptomyces TaxID=2593676 RepID=UPI0036589330
MNDPRGAGTVVRVERGRADDEELAAVTVVLLSLLAGRTEQGAAEAERPDTVRWRRWDRSAAFRGPHSWQ